LLAGIRVSLQTGTDLEILSLNENEIDLMPRLDALYPDVLVFDMTNGQPSFTLELVKHYPALTLIGVDLTQNNILMLSSQQPQVLTMDDLVNVIDRRHNADPSQSR
jgi:hypothetical protein